MCENLDPDGEWFRAHYLKTGKHTLGLGPCVSCDVSRHSVPGQYVVSFRGTRGSVLLCVGFNSERQIIVFWSQFDDN